MSTFAEKSQETNAIRQQMRLEEAMASHPGTCDCGKQGLFWASTVKGRSILMDPEVSSQGSWLVTPLMGNRLLARHLNQHDRRFYPGASLRTCHFDSCSARKRNTVVEAERAKQLRESA